MSARKVETFVKRLPAIEAKEIKQDFSCPLWSNTETANDIHVGEGALTISSASAAFKIPLWGVVSSASISGISIKPSAQQIVAAEKVQQAVATAAAVTGPNK